MTYRIFDDMTQCTEQEVARLLPLVSDQRREQALAYKHLFGQFCCLKSYEMLQQLLASTPYTLHHTPTFLYNANGAPRLEHGPCFSISHCKNAIAVAISETPIGIDIEHLRTAKPELVARTMNEHEQLLIQQAKDPDWAFTQLWTQKEAVLKMQGTGITSIEGIKNTLVALENIDLQTKVNIDKQYAYTLASRL
ncbi:MAG: 4'-phosphopantetheinyl transferase superfamily protein [Paludibacteraceae bacterium]|nr:4'-phosphopantetheinyl transferase superfamily protein [Paludibacteraceae bacterium]